MNSARNQTSHKCFEFIDGQPPLGDSKHLVADDLVFCFEEPSTYLFLRVYADGPSIIPTFDLIATIMHRRRFCSLGYIEGRLSRRDDKLLLDKGRGRELELEGLCLDRLHNRIDGAIEFLIDFSSKSLFFAVFQGKETITAKTIASLTDSMLPRTLSARRLRFEPTNVWRPKQSATPVHLKFFSIALRGVGWPPRLFGRALEEKAMGSVLHDQIAGLHALLAKQGYWVALDKDRSALRCLAALSMVDSTGLAPAISRLVEEGTDVASGVAALERLNAEYPGSIFVTALEGRTLAV